MKRTPLLLIIAAALAAALFLFLQSRELPSAGDAPLGIDPSGSSASGNALSPEGDALPAPALAGGETPGREAVPERRTKEAKKEATEAERLARRAKGPFLRGLVRTSEGLPVGGATVKVSGELGSGAVLGLGELALAEEAVTDSNGSFRVPRGMWPVSDMAVTIDARGFLPFEGNGAPDRDDGDASLGTFELERGVVLAGRVVDADEQPVAAAQVRRIDREDSGNRPAVMAFAESMGQIQVSRTETDEEGRFELPFEAVGEYALVVEHPRHPKARFEGTTPAAGSEDLNIVVRFAQSAEITGRLVGYPGGRENVSIRARLLAPDGEQEEPAFLRMFGSMTSDIKATPLDDGSFELIGLLAQRRYEVQSYVMSGLMQQSPCSEKEEVPAGTEGLELTWDGGAAVLFSLVDEATGKPLTNGSVRFRWQDSTGSWMANARKLIEFHGTQVVIPELRPVPSPSNLEFAVMVDGYLDVRRSDIEVTELEDVDLGQIALRRSPRLRVQVVEAASGEPLRSARVVLRPNLEVEEQQFFSLGGKHATGKTDRDGWCDLEACSTPTATLSVRRRGFAPQVIDELAMPGQGEREEVVRLFEGGEITVTVRDAEGQPAAEKSVRHRSDGDQSDPRQTGRDGTLLYRDLGPGEHSFRLGGRQSRRRGGGVRANFEGNSDADWTSVVLTSGGRANVSLDLPPTGTLKGVVTIRGEPTSGVRVSLLPGSEVSDEDEMRAQLGESMAQFMPDGGYSTRTGSDGSFELNDLPLGDHQLRLVRDEGTPPHYVPVEVREGSARADVALPSAAVEGRVTDSDGTPLQGITVRIRRVRESSDEDELVALESAMSFFGGASLPGPQTDASGRYRVEGIPEGVPLTVEARGDDYVPGRSEPFDVTGDQIERSVNIALTGAGRIRVRFEGSVTMFQQVFGRRISGEGEGNRSARGFAQDGRVLLKNLAPGTWSVALDEDDVENGTQVEVRAGQTSEVVLGG